MEQFQHLLQYGLDLLIWGDPPDRVGSTNKRALFHSLKSLYQQLGSRFSSLNFATFPIDWQAAGHYSVNVTGDNVVQVRCKLLGEVQNIPAQVLGSDLGLFTNIENNSSIKLAALVTTRDAYNLQNLFPRLCRSLRRRPSDELGATSSTRFTAAALAAATAPERDGAQGPPDYELQRETCTTRAFVSHFSFGNVAASA